DFPQIVEQGTVFAGLGTFLRPIAFNGLETVLCIVMQPFEMVALSGDCVGRLMSLEDTESVVDGFDEGFRTGERGFSQSPEDEAGFAGIGARTVGMQPDLRSEERRVGKEWRGGW